MRFEIQVHTLVSQPQKVSNLVEWQGVFVAVVVKFDARDVRQGRVN